jgi:hypothetical protein
MKPSKFLKSSPPRSITTPGELPFQEGRPLHPSDDKDEGQVVRSAKCFAPNREGVERVQLDDYLLDSFGEEEGWIAKSSSPDREVFMVFIEEIPFTEADASYHVQINDYFAFMRTLSNLPMATSTRKLVGSGTHSIND